MVQYLNGAAYYTAYNTINMIEPLYIIEGGKENTFYL